MNYKLIITPTEVTVVRKPFTAEDKTTVKKEFKDHTGKHYAQMVDGSIRRLAPFKPWHGKAERRQTLKARREQRANQHHE